MALQYNITKSNVCARPCFSTHRWPRVATYRRREPDFVCGPENRMVCVVRALVRPSAASPPNECYHHEGQAFSVGSRSACSKTWIFLGRLRLFFFLGVEAPDTEVMSGQWPRNIDGSNRHVLSEQEQSTGSSVLRPLNVARFV